MARHGIPWHDGSSWHRRRTNYAHRLAVRAACGPPNQ